MAFSASGASPNIVITQTGTDTSLAGLSGLSGVTTLISGSVDNLTTIYQLSGARLVVNGTLTHTISRSTQEILILNENCPQPGITVGATGIYNYGQIVNYTPTGSTFYSISFGLAVLRRGTPWLLAQASISIVGGGTFNWNGGGIKNHAGIHNSGTLVIRDGVLINGPSSAAGQAGRLVLTTGTNNINGLRMQNGLLTPAVQLTALLGFDPRECDTAAVHTGPFNQKLLIENYAGAGRNQIDFLPHNNLTSGNYYTVKNAQTGSRFNWDGNAPAGGWVTIEAVSDLNVSTRQLNGTAITGAVVYAKDYNNGNRQSNVVNCIGQSFNFSADIVYSATTNVSGLAAFSNIVTAYFLKFASSKIFDYRSKSNNDLDLFDFYCAHYLYSLQTLNNVSLWGIGIKSATATLFDDPAIVQSDPATVAAYTGYSLNTGTDTLTITDASLNGARVYDWLKLWKVNNFALEYPTISTLVAVKNEPVLNLGNLNIVVDGVTWASHATVTAITTTGTIAFINGADYNVVVTDSTGTRYPAVTIAGFPTANNSNGIAPAPRVAITNLRTNTTQAYTVSGSSIAIKLSDVGALPADDILVTADAIGYLRPLDQTVKGNRTEPLSFTFEPWLNARGQEIVGLESAASIDFDLIEERLELPAGSISFYAALMQWETVTAGGSFYLFPTEAVRRFDFAEGFDGTKRVVIADPWTIAAKPGAASSPIISDFTVISQTVTRDPFDHGLPSTAPGLTDRPEVVVAFQTPGTSISVTAIGTNAITADSLASSAIEEIRDAFRVPTIQ